MKRLYYADERQWTCFPRVIAGSRITSGYVGALAKSGWVVSAGWHLAVRLDLVRLGAWVGVPLVFGLFLVWFPAVIGAGRSGFRFADRRRWWALAAMSAVFAFVNMWFLGEGTVYRRMSLVLSGHLMAFYAFAAAMGLPPQGVKR